MLFPCLDKQKVQKSDTLFCSIFTIENSVYMWKPRYGGILKGLIRTGKIMYAHNFLLFIYLYSYVINQWHNLHIFFYRFVWTFVVEKGKTCVESNCSRINFYSCNLNIKTTKLKSRKIINLKNNWSKKL